MITGMGNLGPPLKANSDLLARKGDETPNLARKDREESGSDSFERTLEGKAASRSNEKLIDRQPGRETREKRPPDRAEKSEMRESRIENRNEEANNTVKGNEQGEVSSQDEGKSLSPRQRVMQKFMDSMESEFGIPPQRIVEAMAQLTDHQLLQAPDETASQVIDKLDLEPQDAEKAEAMYIAMLGTLSGSLAQVRDPEPLRLDQKVLMGAGGLAVGAQAAKLISSRERRELLNNSLEQMNNKFFMRPGDGKFSTEAVLPGVAKESNVLSAEVVTPKAQAFETYRSLAEQRPELAADALKLPQKVQTELNPTLQAAVAEMQPLSDDEANAEGLKALAALGLAAGALAQAIQEDPVNAAALKMDQAMQNSTQGSGMAANFQAQLQAQGLQGSSGKAGGNSTGGRGKGGDTNFFVDSMGSGAASEMGKINVGQQAVPPTPSQFVGAQAAAAGGAGALIQSENKGDTQANIQQVMNQAQYMIKKGGGEAIVKLNPEGLGQVHLKVILSEGKVNVEMQTETQEAKKMLESSLTDLKSSLNTHKLAIDHVKVDVGNNFAGDGKDPNQQQRMDQGLDQRDMNREQTRQFMGQFREENQAARDGFYETTGVKAYGANRRTVDPLKPAEEAKSQALRRYQGSGKGSGLDLVA